MRWHWAALALFAAAIRWAAAAPITLPIYIEDSHAGSFYWLAEQLDLDEEYTLIHFDAHSDASAIFDSDKLRERLRRVASLEERRQLLERWRETGVIQCFNWIEPLMPGPIPKMIWVPQRDVAKTKARTLQHEAVDFFDGHLEAAPRGSGSFRERCRVMGFDQLRASLKEDGPVVITIDLDYFAGVPASVQAREFERVWKFVSECRNLRAVTFAISRPLPNGGRAAESLLRLALTASLSLPTATIQFEPSKRPQRPIAARPGIALAGKGSAGFRADKRFRKLRAILLANRGRITVRTKAAAWEKLLGEWEKEAPAVRLALKNREPSTDNIWRLPVAEEAELELQSEPWDAAIGKIEMDRAYAAI